MVAVVVAMVVAVVVRHSQEVQVVQVAQRVRGQAAQRAAVQPQPRQRRAPQRARRHRLQPVGRQVPAQHNACHSPRSPALCRYTTTALGVVLTARAAPPPAAARRAAAC